MSEIEQLPSRKEITAAEFIKIWKGTYRNLEKYQAFYQTGEEGAYIMFDKYKVIGDIVVESLNNLPEVHLHNTETKDIIINNSTTKDIFIFDNSIIGAIKIANSKTATIWCLHHSKTDYVRIENSHIYGLWVVMNKSLGYIEIATSKIATLNLYAASVATIYIKSDTSINRLSLKQLNHESKSLDISDSTIGELELMLSYQYNITVKANDAKKYSTVQNLKFVDTTFPVGVNINIAQTHINKLQLASFINQGIVVFSDVMPIEIVEKFQLDKKGNAVRDIDGVFRLIKSKPNESPSTIEIKDSDVGNMQFIGCSLASFSKFIFRNSKLQNIFLADTQLPAKESITTHKADLFEQRRLALSQFKKIYETQGDAVRASEYRAEEMEVYRHYLLRKKNLPTRKERWNRRAELTNLWLNKFSSYYGNNWLRGVVVTFGVSTILYTWYCSSRGILPASVYNDENWKTFGRLLPYYFEFLNPIHKTSFFEHIEEGEPNPGALLIDYLSRIVVSYLVYQTIAAFRKFGKRSA